VKAAKLIERAAGTDRVKGLESENTKLRALLAEHDRLRKAKVVKVQPAKPLRRPPESFIRVIVPDSHGAHADPEAMAAFMADLKMLDPAEIVLIGDHLDCGGTFSSHQRSYTNEMAESYSDDVAHCNGHLDGMQEAAPRAWMGYLEGNHEQHIERWAARNFSAFKDAEMFVGAMGPRAVLNLDKRGIEYYKRSVHYDGLSIPGAIRRGKIVFVHGISHSKHATFTHLIRVGTNVVHGHTHRAQSAVERTVMSDGFGAWCPGTLAKLQPLYKHTEPTSWSHGYAVQFVQRVSGRFLHLNVSIADGESQLMPLAKMLR
jgi:hypothetical protein